MLTDKKSSKKSSTDTNINARQGCIFFSNLFNLCNDAIIKEIWLFNIGGLTLNNISKIRGWHCAHVTLKEEIARTARHSIKWKQEERTIEY